MHARGWLLILLFTLGLAEVGTAEEPTLLDRLSIPKQGHVEVKRAIIADLDGVQLKTVADVVKLRDQLEAIPYDRESILKWKFLDQLGLSVVKHDIPPSPPGVKIELIQDPAWTTTVYDFTKDTYVDRTSYDATEEINAGSPVSSVSMRRVGDYRSVIHFLPDQQQMGAFDPNLILMRTRDKLDHAYEVRQAAGKAFHVRDHQRYESWIWVDPEQDAILAAASVDKKNDRVFGCTLFMYLRSPDANCRFAMPRLALRFSHLPGDVCNLTMYHFDQADFETQVQPKQLQVPVKEGAHYTYRANVLDYQRRFPQDIDDILSLSPKQVQKMIENR